MAFPILCSLSFGYGKKYLFNALSDYYPIPKNRDTSLHFLEGEITIVLEVYLLQVDVGYSGLHTYLTFPRLEEVIKIRANT